MRGDRDTVIWKLCLWCLLAVCCVQAIPKHEVSGSDELPEDHVVESVSVVTQNGAVSNVIRQKRAAESRRYTGGGMEMRRSLDLNDKGDNLMKSRSKRVLQGNQPWYAWPRGLVPYVYSDTITDFFIGEAKLVIARYEKNTCLRFIPWQQGVTKQQYNLPDEGHMIITYGSCSSHVGFMHWADGQNNKCCGRDGCTHEMGHALGLPHEQVNPYSWGFIRNQISTSAHYIQKPDDSTAYQYDYTSIMHYPVSQVLYEDLSSLPQATNRGNLFYAYKDLSLFHQCQELYCQDFTMTCYNNGYVTKVNDVCACYCPPGLDPATGCKTNLKDVPRNSVWPRGAYGLLAPVDGCPPGFSTGSVSHTGQGGNKKSSDFRLAGQFGTDTFQYQFCVKDGSTDSSTAPDKFEAGQYCILRKGGSCPQGFDTGFIQFDDKDGTTASTSGAVPDGSYTGDVRLEFCCRNDGFDLDPMENMPNTKAMVLLVMYEPFYEQRVCQSIRGMRVSQQWFEYKSYPTNAAMGGLHPSVYGSSQFQIQFCYYEPVNMDCGGEVTLNKNSRTAVIKSPGYPQAYGANMECTWVIRSEVAGGRVLLNFDTFKVTGSGNNCKDNLEIRYNLPGQEGVHFCGDGIGRTIRSLNESVVMTLRTDRDTVATDTGFSVQVSLFIPEEEECFAPDTKGVHYRGHKSYTRGAKPCLPWSQITNCPDHLFRSPDFNVGLEENYCRNPDDTAMPWCYVDDKCGRDYCDVCNIERTYDRAAACSDKVCQMSTEKIIAQGCIKSCNKNPPTAPRRDQMCSAPASLPDATIVNNTKVSYKVGEIVLYKCDTGEDTLRRTCLSNGEWSPAGYVCGACDVGWAYYKGACLKWFPDYVTYAEAKETCGLHSKSSVMSIRDSDEMSFASALRNMPWESWLGLTDDEVEGTFKWADGTPLSFTNWESGQPNNWGGAQDCVRMHYPTSDLLWDDRNCADKNAFTCKYTLSERKTCADRSLSCKSLLTSLPSMCSDQPDYANQQCPFSCSVCQNDQQSCDVTPTADDGVVLKDTSQSSTIQAGATVTYECKAGWSLTSGQLHVACGADGQLIGRPKCQDPNTLVQDSNQVQLVPRSTLAWNNYFVSGPAKSLSITRSGVIKQWKFYSTTVGNVFFQVWRPAPGGNQYSVTLVGQNQVLGQGQGLTTADVAEEDWITVQAGDRIGIYEQTDYRAGVQFDKCDQSANPDDYGVSWISSSYSVPDLSPGTTYQFQTSDIRCMTFSFKAVIHPVTSKSKQATSQVPVVHRNTVGAAVNVYLADGASSLIPLDGKVTRWEYYANYPGSGAFQVWRRVGDKADKKYTLIGQNPITLASGTAAGRYSFPVPVGERIVVKQGDIIAFYYGSSRLGLPYTFCDNLTSNPEWMPVRWLERGDAQIGQTYTFGVSTSGTYLCRIFSLRAIVE